MLGIRLQPEQEEMLDRHARDVGRPKSNVARDWIIQGLERDSIDAQMRIAALVVRDADPAEQANSPIDRDAEVAAWLAALDREDGGYGSDTKDCTA